MTTAMLADLQEALLLVFRPLLNIYMALLLVGSIFGALLAGLMEMSRRN